MSQIAWRHFFFVLNLKNQIMLSTALQAIPQYIEGPPNIEAKRIISCFSVIPSYWPNHMLLMVELNSWFSFGYWPATCRYGLDDLGHHTNEGPFWEANEVVTDDCFAVRFHKNVEGIPPSSQIEILKEEYHEIEHEGSGRRQVSRSKG